MWVREGEPDSWWSHPSEEAKQERLELYNLLKKCDDELRELCKPDKFDEVRYSWVNRAHCPITYKPKKKKEYHITIRDNPYATLCDLRTGKAYSESGYVSNEHFTPGYCLSKTYMQELHCKFDGKYSIDNYIPLTHNDKEIHVYHFRLFMYGSATNLAYKKKADYINLVEKQGGQNVMKQVKLEDVKAVAKATKVLPQKIQPLNQHNIVVYLDVLDGSLQFEECIDDRSGLSNLNDSTLELVRLHKQYTLNELKGMILNRIKELSHEKYIFGKWTMEEE